MDKETTNESAVKETPETTDNKEQAESKAPAEPTVAELHEDEPAKSEQSEKAEKPDSVPLSKFVAEKQKRKALQKELDALRADLEEDPDVEDEEIEDRPDVKALADKLDKIEKDKRREQLNVAFEKHLNAALENAPEYKDIVNVEVIRQMAFNPANKDKTYAQLLEEAYGNAISGRRTIETTTPRGGAKDSKVDLDRARTDQAYRREVLADPELKRQYNEGLTDRIPL